MKNVKLFDDPQVLQVWLKATPVTGYDETEWRCDEFGNLIRCDAYDDQDNEYGWKIDRIISVADDETNDLSNLRPLQCKAKVRRIRPE